MEQITVENHIHNIYAFQIQKRGHHQMAENTGHSLKERNV
jgi:hypothetical protein